MGNKMIKKFKNFEYIREVSHKKMRNIDDTNLTFSIEIEMETDSQFESDYIKDSDVDRVLGIIKKSVLKDINRLEIEFTSSDSKFLDGVLDKIRNGYQDDDKMERILNPDSYTGTRSYIIEQLLPLYTNYFQVSSLGDLEDELSNKLPNFWSKWSNHFKTEIDNTLKSGIEISNKTYSESLGEFRQIVGDFYSDFKNQDFWQFNDRTGIHINIGSVTPVSWNPFKGLLFLDDETRDSFVFSGMEWRWDSPFVRSLKSKLRGDSELTVISNKLLSEGDISKLEEILNDKLIEEIKKSGFKNFGVNLLNISLNNYVEFRYPGGEISKETLLEKIDYFTYLTKVMIDQRFERELYLKKLYKFFN